MTGDAPLVEYEGPPPRPMQLPKFGDPVIEPSADANGDRADSSEDEAPLDPFAAVCLPPRTRGALGEHNGAATAMGALDSADAEPPRNTRRNTPE